MVKKIYIDTLVVGGYFDDEFEFWTKLFFGPAKDGKFHIEIRTPGEILNYED